MNDKDPQQQRLVKFIDRRSHDCDVKLRDGIIVRVTRLGLQTRVELRISVPLIKPPSVAAKAEPAEIS